MQAHPILQRENPPAQKPGNLFLQILKEEFCAPDINLQEEILPCEVPIAERLGQRNPTLAEGFLPGEFDPRGLNKTYYDQVLQMELPKFGVINVRRSAHRIKLQQTTFEAPVQQTKEGNFRDLDNFPTPTIQFLPEHEGMQSLRKRERSTRALIWIPTLLISLTTAIFSQNIWNTIIPWSNTWNSPSYIALGLPALLLATCAGLIFYFLPGRLIRSLRKLHLQESFRFELPGLLPDNIRTQISKMLPKFEDIYLVCDAEDAWESEGTQVITEARKKELDPLLIGERKGRFFLIGWFDLTNAETLLTRNVPQE